MPASALRRLHLEFHNSPLIKRIGEEVDPVLFAQRLKASFVEEVVLCAKCRHGMSYYDTRIGQRHPHMEKDVFGKLALACRNRDIRVLASYSCVWDDALAETHPDWLQRDGMGKPKRPRPSIGWASLCLNSPYTEKILLPQLGEIIKKYRIDGLWLDGVEIPNGSCHCNVCLERMKKMSYDASREDDCRRFGQITNMEFMRMLKAEIEAMNPALNVISSSGIKLGRTNLGELMDAVDLDFGTRENAGLRFAVYAGYLRTKGIAFTGRIPRFQNGWGDFGTVKSVSRLEREIGTVQACGGGCSLGDQILPSGRFQSGVYDKLEKHFSRMAALEPWLRDAASLSQVGILATPRQDEALPDGLCGMARALIGEHVQFDVLDGEDADAFSVYEAVLVPDVNGMPLPLANGLATYVEQGGKVLATGNIFDTNDESREVLETLFGTTFFETSPQSVNYIRLEGGLADGIPVEDLVVYSGHVRTNLMEDATELGKIIEPYFERSSSSYTSHRQAPPHRASRFPAIVRTKNTLYLGLSLPTLYENTGYWAYRKLIGNLLDLLLEGRAVITNLPASVMVGLNTQRRRLMLHLVERGGQSDDGELVDQVCRVGVRLGAVPARVYMASGKQPLSFVTKGDYVEVALPDRRGIHSLVVFEWGNT